MAEYKIKFSKAVEDSSDAAAAVSEAATVTGEAMRVAQTPVWPISSAGSFDASAATSAEGTVELLKCVAMGSDRQLYLMDGVGASDAWSIKETPGKYQEILKTFQDKFNAVHGSASEPLTAQSSFLNCDDKPVPRLSLAQAADIVQVLSALDALQIGSVGNELKALTAKYKEKRDQMEEKFKRAKAAADETVECASKAESVEKTTVEKAKNSLSNAVEKQKQELCAIVEQLQKDKERAVRLMRIRKWLRQGRVFWCHERGCESA
ncbi:hypothetical protein ERJ75_000344000 [Trypanosoma vivax]|nr:hypothetical protein ERJ75_000344000 [Trypanosoma vivax]